MSRFHNCRRRFGLTLIEMLIVVAILAILSSTTLMIILDATRVEKGVARQRDSADQISMVEQAWRSDVHGARSVVMKPSQGYETGPTAVILEVADPQTGVVEYRAIAARPNKDGTIAIQRVRLTPDGTVLSRQVLAERLDDAGFSYDADTRLCTLRIGATRGFGAYKNHQQFTALAALR